MGPGRGHRRARAVPAYGAGSAGTAVPARRDPSGAVHDDRWPGQARFAAGGATLLFTLLLCVDGAAGQVSWLRAGLWAGLSVLLFVVLIPARVSVDGNRLISRGLLRKRSVRTDRLVSLRWSEGVAERLVLCDTDGGRVEIDPRVLVASPALWHRIDRNARVSLREGTLLHGVTALRGLTRRLDGESAQLVFRRSGLD